MLQKSQIPERLKDMEKEAQLTAEQLERKARKAEQHENMLKSIGIEKVDETKASVRKQVGSEPKIGISNPFVLTELILDETIDWSNPKSKTLLEETLESSYEDLIHKKDSVLLACQNTNPTIREEVEREDIESVANTEQLNKLVGKKQLDVISSQKRGNKITLDVLIPEKREKALSSSHITKLIQEIVKPDMMSKTAGVRKSNPSSETKYFHEMGVCQTFIPDRYNSIIQGGLGDCYFLAALCSIAWVWPGLLKMDVDLGNTANPLYYYHLFTHSTTAHGTKGNGWGKTDNRFVFMGDYNMPVYARGRRWFDGDLWAAYWEKLYATWRYAQMKGEFPTTNAQMLEAFGIIGSGGWPQYSLKEIAGNKFDVGVINLKSQSLAALTKFFQEKTDSYWVTKYPMVLWTFDATLPNLVNSHAYSVLGVVNYNNKHYIVIRNPWGYREPGGAGTLGGTYVLQRYFETIQRVPQSEVIKFSDNDGIFAMELSVMQQQFTGLGYIY